MLTRRKQKRSHPGRRTTLALSTAVGLCRLPQAGTVSLCGPVQHRSSSEEVTLSMW